MGKKQKKKGHGADKTAAKTERKALKRAKKEARTAGEDDIEAIVASLEAEQLAKDAPLCEKEVPDRPTVRKNFSWTPDPKSQEIHLFGGEARRAGRLVVYNEHFVYKLPSNAWVQLRGGALPTPRCAHQAAVAKASGQQSLLFVFGGEFASPNESQFHHYGDLWACSLKARLWRRVHFSGQGPCPRSGHRMIAMRRSLFVFGGFQDNGRSRYRYLSDLWQWSCEHSEWTELRASCPPSPRSACLLFPLPAESGLCLFGGYAMRTDNKVERSVVHTDSHMLLLGGKGSELSWQQMKISGQRPSPRCGVSGCVNPDTGKAYLFGGVYDIEEGEDSMTSVMFNELFQLDLAKQRWRAVNYSQAGGDNSEEATAAEAGACVPLERINCGLVVLHNQLVLYAGQNEDEDSGRTRILDDLQCIDLRSLRCWRQLQPLSAKQQSDAAKPDDADDSSASSGEGDRDGQDEEEEDDEGDEGDEEDEEDEEGGEEEGASAAAGDSGAACTTPAVREAETMDAYCARTFSAWQCFVRTSLSKCWSENLISDDLVDRYARRAAKDHYRKQT